MTTCADWIGSVSSTEQMPSSSNNEILMRFNTQYPTGSNLQTWYMYNETARRVFFKNELFKKKDVRALFILTAVIVYSLIKLTGYTNFT